MKSLPDFKHGDTFTLACTYKLDGVPASLTGKTLASQIRTVAGELVAGLTVTQGNQITSPGSFTLTAAAGTTTWPIAGLRCDIQITEGDILFASPTIPGGLTKVEPAPPNVAIIIAAVVKADALDGTLLVRPALFPRLQYGVFTDTADQTQTAPNTAKAVTFNTTEISSGVALGAPSSRIVVERAGLYDFGFSLQVAKTGGTTRNIWIWARHNGIDVPRSNQQKSIGGSSSTEVPAWNFTLSMAVGDYFELMWAVDNTEVFLDSDAAPAFGPSIPSAILTVAKINQ